MRWFVVLIVLLLALTSCRSPEVAPQGLLATKLNPAAWPEFTDQGSKKDLLHAIDAQLKWLETRSDYQMTLADQTIDQARLRQTLQRFRAVVEQHFDDPQKMRLEIEADFDCYLLTNNGKPDLLITGYFAPTYQGSLEPDSDYRYPLYALPDDLILVDTKSFDPRMLQKGPAPREASIPARLDNGRVVGYHSRADIDGNAALANKGLELVYLKDYFEQFTLHVQGGGFVQLPNGRYMKIDYAGKNGHSYTSIGRLMIDAGLIKQEDISMQAIEAWFQEHPEDVERICFQNASYVFYTTTGETYPSLNHDLMPNGVLNFPVTPRRSIATDKRYFPGGALCFLQGHQRRMDGPAKPFSTFVLDQDTGGAIRENHVDLFQGVGPQAERDAGQLKDSEGRLYFLVIKPFDES